MEPKAKRSKFSSSSIVELNVGGGHFSTSKETLLQYGSSYFARLLSDVVDDDRNNDSDDGVNASPAALGVRGANRDKDGRLYIDKDPYLFKHILDFLRGTFDPDDLTDKERKKLRKEALYYGLETLHELLRPAPSGYEEYFLSGEDQLIRKQAQLIREQLKSDVDGAPVEADGFLIDVFSSYNDKPVLEGVFEHPLTSPNASILFEAKVEIDRSRLRLSVATTADEFKQRMIEFGGPLLENFPFDKNLVVAGGSVLQALLHDPADLVNSDSDIDLFLVAPTPDDGIEAYNAILEHISYQRRQNHGDESRRIGHVQLLVTRSSHAVTFCICEPQRHIQLILIQHPCIASVLFNFDIDCCQIAWDGRNNRVLATPSAVRAIQTGVNFADPERCTSTEYEIRLAKFAKRGFMVAVPGLNTARIKDSLLRDTCYSFVDSELRRLSLKFTDWEKTPEELPFILGLDKVAYDEHPPVRGLAKLIVASSIGKHKGNYFIDWKKLHKYTGDWKKPTPPNSPPEKLTETEISVARCVDSVGRNIMPWRDVQPSNIARLIHSHEGRHLFFSDGIRRRKSVYDYLVNVTISIETPNVRDGKNQFPDYPFSNQQLYTGDSSIPRFLKFVSSIGDQTPWKLCSEEEWVKGVYE